LSRLERRHSDLDRVLGQEGQVPEAVAIALGKAFPSWVVRVRWDRGRPRFEALAKDGRNPVCLISANAQEIWAELEGTSNGG
jgi:hypothetical protein